MEPPMQITNQTHTTLGKEFADVTGRGLYVSLQWDTVRLENSDPEKNGQREKRLRVMKQPIGDPSTCSSTYMTPDQVKERFPAEWEYFVRTGDMPSNGTALSELPGISVSQMQQVQLSGLRSIEDVASAPMETINRIGHEGRYVQTLAVEWVRRAKSEAKLIDYAEHKAALVASNDAADARAVRAENASRALQARLEALEAVLRSGGGNMPTAQDGGDKLAGYDAGPALDTTPNPLADGDGTMGDDILS